jgi:SAM-dependent methyltransferase
LNYFAPKTAAERYAKGRPFFHPRVIERVKEFLSLDELLPRGLDVCCGTGHSTIALKELAAQVVGVDVSAEMLAFVPNDANVKFFMAAAENLPFGEDSFDIVTVCQALHWLDKRKFLAEARRVLRAGGQLVAYDNFMTGRMAESEEFRQWFKSSYIERFPAPLRERILFDADEAESEGFHLCREERFENAIIFSPERLVEYLTTHSNVIAAVEGGSREIGEVRSWIAKGIERFYGGAEEAHFIFEAAFWCLQRAGGV